MTDILLLWCLIKYGVCLGTTVGKCLQNLPARYMVEVEVILYHTRCPKNCVTLS
jgi:hypothetical protein